MFVTNGGPVIATRIAGECVVTYANPMPPPAGYDSGAWPRYTTYVQNSDLALNHCSETIRAARLNHAEVEYLVGGSGLKFD